MRKYLRKAQTGRRARIEEDSSHWLGEGAYGQELLLAEVDPHLFSVDRAISSQVSSLSHRIIPGEDGVYAVLILPEGGVGWQLGYLSRCFNTYVWSSKTDELLDSAARHFGALLLSGDLLAEVDRRVDLLIHTDYLWPSERVFVEEIRCSMELLNDEGVSMFVLVGCREKREESRPLVSRVLGSKNFGEDVIEWSDGRRSYLSWLLSRFESSEVFSVSVAESLKLDPSEFIKRNRGFFGRNIRDMMLKRMGESDFQDAGREESGKRVHLFCVKKT
jgi:hypothetical protein